jgi:PAS domain S-box-containing protein
MEPITSFEEHYNYIFENIRDIIFILSPEGTIKSVTREFENITGWSREAWLGRHFTELVHPDDIDSVVEKFALVISGRKPASYETRVRSLSGEYLTFESKSTAQIIDGQVVGFLGIARDVTHRKQAEEAIRASEQQYRDIIDSLGDPIHVIDKDFTIILVNRAFITWLDGLGINSNIRGETIQEAFPFVESNKVTEEYNTVFTTKKPLVTVEATEIGDTTYFTETRKIPIRRNEEVVQVITIIRDISESKRTEKQLRESEERLRSFMDAATDSFSLWDSDLNLIDINKTGLEWFSRETKREEVIGRNMMDFAHKPSDLDNFLKVLKTGEPFSSDETAPHEMFGDLVISIKGFKVGDGLGLITTDITSRKKMEKALIESEERQRRFMDAATESFSLWDSNLNLVDLNRNAIKKFLPGYKRMDLIGKNMKDLITDPEGVNQYMEVLKTGKPLFIDNASTPEIYGDSILSVRAFKVGDGLGLITNDITEQKKMEHELKESEEKFRSIFENAPIGMALADLDFQFRQVNTSFCEMLGYSEQELIQMVFNDISHPEQSGIDAKFVENIKNGSISSSKIEKKYIKKNQDVLWARTTIIALRDENGALTYFLLICEDISGMKEKEEEIRRQLLKYKTEDGNIYLIQEKTPILSFTVLKDLVEFGYNGFIISRTLLKDYNENIDEYDVEYVHLNETFSSSKVLEYLETIKDKSVVLIDRLEYLFNTEGSEMAILFIYKLRDIAYLRDLVVILSIDDSTFKDRELQILEKETKQIEPRFITNIADELRDILHIIYQQNALGSKPSYSDIGQLLQISRPTVRKRIKRLVTTGYIIEHKLGKRKLLEISTKGTGLLSS